MRSPIDLSLYVRMFPLDVPSTVALCVRLLGGVPRSKSPRDKDEAGRLRPAASTLRERAVELQRAWKIREETGVTKLRPLDIEWDAAWSALLSRLESWSIFTGSHPHAADAAKAAALIALLFPKRLDFTRLELNSQWAEGSLRQTWIQEKKLRGDLVKLAGEPFVARVEETHEALGRALGLTGEPPNADLPLVVDLVAAKRAVHDAIVAYALQLAAADATATDELSAQIRSSLATIDLFRPSVRREAAEEGTDPAGGDPVVNAPVVETPVDPNTPIPPLPEE